MKRYKKLVIGGISSKIFILILLTVILVSAAYLAVSLIHGRMLSKLVVESSEKQHVSITETTSSSMDQVVTQSLWRGNRTEARLTNTMLDSLRARVTFLGSCAATLFADPESYSPRPYSGPDPNDDGIWSVKAIYADGVDPSDPALVSKLGLLANISDTMISLCSSFETSSVYFALPEGGHLSASATSSDWLEDGRQRSYDPRERQWYQQAVEAGELIFTDGEFDAVTGVYCIECAMPVYGPDGSLQAVVGADLYLNEIQKVLHQLSSAGEYTLLINQNGQAILPAQAEVFPMDDADRSGDIRDSRHEVLGQTVENALQGNTANVALGELRDGAYFIAASPIKATGWVLISAYRQDVSVHSAVVLQENLERIQEESRGTYQARTRLYRNAALVLAAAVMILALAGALMLGKRIVTPLNKITRRISELSGNKMEFTMEDAYRTGDEVEKLAESFSELSYKASAYYDEVVKVTAERERIGTELALANRIQADMLPNIFPPYPDRPEFDIYATMEPAREVGGDFYDFFLIDSDHLCLVMADVSGKGIPAALFMMMTKIILTNTAMLGKTPAEILSETNTAICDHNREEMFVTVWLGILEISTGKLTAANAGHEYPVFMRDGKFSLLRDKHGFVIGGMDGLKYKEYELRLEPGEKLFLYTDGVTEATDSDSNMFGTERMLAALNQDPKADPEAILNQLHAAVDEFVKDAEQFDDLTMLCVEYRGNAGE